MYKNLNKWLFIFVCFFTSKGIFCGAADEINLPIQDKISVCDRSMGVALQKCNFRNVLDVFKEFEQLLSNKECAGRCERAFDYLIHINRNRVTFYGNDLQEFIDCCKYFVSYLEGCKRPLPFATPGRLGVAFANGHIEVVKMFFERGFIVDEDFHYLVNGAFNSGLVFQEAAVRLLLDTFPDATRRFLKEQRINLSGVVSPTLAKFLKDEGLVDKGIYRDKAGNTLLHRAILSAKEKRVGTKRSAEEVKKAFFGKKESNI